MRVRAAGLCGTELHFVDGLYAPANVPITLGHEVAGDVSAVGRGVGDFTTGDRVVVNYYLFCARCTWCLRGLQQHCAQLRGLFAFVSDGGFAEYVTVPAHCLVRLPTGIDFAPAATLCCSVTTSLHAVAVAEIGVGENVVVVGAGGVGLSLVQVARLRGARVIAVSRSASKRRAAEDLGAALSGPPEHIVGLVRDFTDGAGADVVFELVGRTATMPLAVQMLGKRGRLVFIGYSADALMIDPLALVVAEQRVLSSVGNTHSELELAVDLADRRHIRPVVDNVRPLDEINDGLDRLRRGDVVGRLVLKP